MGYKCLVLVLKGNIIFLGMPYLSTLKERSPSIISSFCEIISYAH